MKKLHQLETESSAKTAPSSAKVAPSSAKVAPLKGAKAAPIDNSIRELLDNT